MQAISEEDRILYRGEGQRPRLRVTMALQVYDPFEVYESLHVYEHLQVYTHFLLVAWTPWVVLEPLIIAGSVSNCDN